MRGINKVILVGNVTRDAEPRQSKTGIPVSNLRLATNRLVKDHDGSSRRRNSIRSYVLAS